MRVLLFDPDNKDLLSGGSELVVKWEKQETATIWLHIEGPIDKEAQKLLIERFNLHRLGIQDASRDRHPPKIEEFPDHTLIIVKALTDDTEDIAFSTLQLALFVGERFLITRSSEHCNAVEELFRLEEENPRRIKKSPGSISCRLIRLFIEHYLTILLELETSLEELEGTLSDSMNDTTLEEVTGYKGGLKRLRRISIYHEQLLHKLQSSPNPGFPEDLVHEINDLHEQQERVGSLTLLFYELSSDLIDGYLSISSHRLNQIMKVLTIVTAIFVPLGFLAGIYGMNFANMPELQSETGYFILLSVMGTIVIILLTTFRRKKWL
ncbi:MAG: magnesium transporter CorA family protein [Verrucomicrobiales bacterium]|nr:magnesium transporter CorA family protein [Verrucomicrobiales bacterium]